MKARFSLRLATVLLTVAASPCLTMRAQIAADPGWPRVFKSGKKQLTVYQPQVDYWRGYTNIHYRCAIALKGVTKQEKFGVAEIDAVTVTDQAERIVALVPTQRDIRFPNTSDSDLQALRRAVDELRPPGQAMTISLDRVLAYLNPAEQPTQHPVELNLEPPKVFYSRQPAILVMILGEPQFQPVETNRTDLLFALNTNWDLFYDTGAQRYFLLNQDNWLTAPEVKGPWTPAQNLPASFSMLPANDNWSNVRQNLPGKRLSVAPVVFVTTEPAELIMTRGEPSYSPINGTRLLRVTDTDSVLFLNSGDGKFYFLVAGRWFRAASLDGPWQAASRDLPADFARIPDSDPAAFVKASVPGTREAQDAVLLGSVPATTTVYTTNATVQVVYNGAPQFKPIETTTVQYAINSPYAVFLAGGKYYCCDSGVWFVSAGAMGPWAYCTSVPAAIYTIPASNPHYNVTYVVVQSATPQTVVYTQTAGYSGAYVATTGVLMFGAGLAVGAIIANNSHRYYCYPPPIHYSYGCGATYHYGYGGYHYRGGGAYGPYGGAGHVTAYNPATGAYSRSAYAYGPHGSASATRTYNPYTGTSTASRSASTPYGSARQGAAYNPYTGARAAGGSVNTAYGSAGRAAAYNPTTGNAAAGGYRSSAYGSAAGVRTSQGTGAAAWNTANSQGSVAKTRSGDVYAGNGDTVYKRDSNGNWSQNSGNGWQNPAKPQSGSSFSSANRPAQAGSYQSSRSSPASSSWSNERQSMESQAQSRSRGNQQSARTQSWQSSAGSRSWGASHESTARSSGGRGGGRRR